MRASTVVAILSVIAWVTLSVALPLPVIKFDSEHANERPIRPPLSRRAKSPILSSGGSSSYSQPAPYHQPELAPDPRLPLPPDLRLQPPTPPPDAPAPAPAPAPAKLPPESFLSVPNRRIVEKKHQAKFLDEAKARSQAKAQAKKQKQRKKNSPRPAPRAAPGPPPVYEPPPVPPD